jgi:hypothetical protein
MDEQRKEIEINGIELFSSKIDFILSKDPEKKSRSFTIGQIAQAFTKGNEKKARKFLNRIGATIEVKTKNPNEVVTREVLTKLIARAQVSAVFLKNAGRMTREILEGFIAYDVTKWDPLAFGDDPGWRALWDLVWENTTPGAGKS